MASAALFDANKSSYRRGDHQYIYGSTVSLNHIIQTFIDPNNNRPDKTPVKYVHIYCDQLLWNYDKQKQDLRIHSKVPGLNGTVATAIRYVQVFARLLFPDWTQTDSLELNCVSETKTSFKMNFYYQSFTEKLREFQFSMTVLDKEPRTESTSYSVLLSDPDPSSAGFSPAWPTTELGAFPTALTEVPTATLSGRPFEAADATSEDRGDDLNISHLSTLLQAMQACALQEITKNESGPETAISYLRFIVRCSRLSSEQAGMNLAATGLLSFLEFPRRFPFPNDIGKASPKFLIPTLNMDRYLELLNSSVTMIKDIEAQMFLLTSFASLQKTQLKSIGNVLQAINIGQASLVDNDANAEAAVQSFISYHAVTDKFELEQKDLVNAQPKKSLTVMQEAFKKYAEDRRQELIFNACLDVFTLVVDVGVAVYTCGAGAPLTKGNFDAILKDINGAVTLPEKLKSIFEKLAVAFPPLYKDLKTTFKQFQHNEKLTSHDDKGSFSMIKDKTIEEAVYQGPVDYLGLIGRWEEFKVDAETACAELQLGLGPRPADGSSSLDSWNAAYNSVAEYRGELKKMAIRGQTILMQQQASAQAIETYYRGLAETNEREKRQKRITEFGKTIEEKEHLSETEANNMLWALQRELINSRLHCAFIFTKTVLSYMYRAGSSNFPSGLTYEVGKSGKEWFNAVEALERLRNSADEKWKNAQDIQGTLVLSTDDAAQNVFQKDWKDAILSDRRVYFNIPADIDALKNYYHIRTVLPSIKLFAKDPKDATKTIEILGVDCVLNLGPQFLDINETDAVNKYWIPQFSLSKKSGWVPEPGHRLDYLDDRDKNLYILPTPMCAGNIRFSEVTKDAATIAENRRQMESIVRIELRLDNRGTLKAGRQ